MLDACSLGMTSRLIVLSTRLQLCQRDLYQTSMTVFGQAPADRCPTLIEALTIVWG